jgi:hypothetical protein
MSDGGSNGDALGESDAPSGEPPGAPVGAWTESDAPPALHRRNAAAPLLRSGGSVAASAAAAQVARRHRGAAIAFGSMQTADESGLSPASARQHVPAAPAAHSDSREGRVLLLRRPGEAPAAGNGNGHEGEAPEEPAVRTTPQGHTAVRLPEGTRLTPSAQSAGRPPVLASEALRKDLAPATPAGPPVRRVIVAAGFGGAVAAFALCGASGLGIPLGGAFLALAVIGLVPMPYQARAAAVVTVSGTALSVVTWSRLERAADLEPLVLLIGVLSLSMALLFRSWHRASLLARALVALGVILCAGWLGMSDGLHKLMILDAGWQRWLPAVLPLPLAIVLLLSLLAFMDSRSTGGCTAWASLVLGWYALQVWVELIPIFAPAQARGFALDRGAAELAVTVLGGPLLTVVLAAGLAQLLSVATAADPE